MNENYVPRRDPMNTEHIISLVRAEIAERLRVGHDLSGTSLEAEIYWITHNSNCDFKAIISAIAGMVEDAVLCHGSGHPVCEAVRQMNKHEQAMEAYEFQ
jgi:hypothetical protein